MLKNTNIEQINSYFDAFQKVLNPDDFLKISNSQVEIELASINAIICISEILTSKFVLKHDIKFQIFSKSKAGYYDFMIILKNIIDLPIIYPKSVRCCAIKQIGYIVRRINNIKESQFIKLVYEFADDFSRRLLSSAKMNKDFIISYLNALGKMAIDQQLQQILLQVLDEYVRTINSFDMNTQIAICKTMQYLKQPTSDILNYFKKLSQSQDAPSSISSYGSLSFISLSIQIGNPINLSKLLFHIQKVKTLESPSEFVVDSTLKIINQIALHSQNDTKRCIEILNDYAFGNSPVCRHKALKMAAILAKKFNDHEMMEKIIQTCITHISNYLNGSTKLLKSIGNTLAVIGMKETSNANQINQLFQTVLNKTYDFPRKIFDYITHFTQPVLRTKTKIIMYNEKDIFENYLQKEKNLSFSDDSDLVSQLHKNLINNGMQKQLLDTFYFSNPKNEYGYVNIKDWFITIPNHIIIYEDILSLFVTCCIDIFKSSSTIPTFQKALASLKADSLLQKNGFLSSDNNNDRAVCNTWAKFVSILGPFAISNYVQLFFGLLKDPDLCSHKALLNILAEIQFTKECIDKRHKDKEKIRKPSVKIDQRSTNQRRNIH
ncbi:hypothetical protein M9Y10_011330 [Tritrichomonas musculus]|uniref:Uncharacterized protein n=1 Tax=Tritrichomonas musculus TaxID=1915356 RepID=A0ABR2IJ42_9EUKA